MEYGHVVSLGYHCAPRQVISELFDLDREYLFDSLVSYRLGSVGRLITEGFSSVFDPSREGVIWTDENPNPDFWKVTDLNYQITSIHNFPKDGSPEESYAAHIQSVRQLGHDLKLLLQSSPEPILLVRRNKNETKKTLDRFAQMMKVIRGCKPLDIWFFTSNNDAVQWKSQNYRMVHDGTWDFDPQSGWVGRKDLWHKAFAEVTLKPSEE